MDKTLAILLPLKKGVVGGAEFFADDLKGELEKRGIYSEIINLPFLSDTRENLIKSILSAQAIDLSKYYGIVCTKFPGYLAEHPNIYLYLIHQHRELYEFFGTRFSMYSHNARDDSLREIIHGMEKRRLLEINSKKTISKTVSARLERYFGISTGHIYIPSPHRNSYREGKYGDYILFVGRLEEDKRPHLFIECLKHLTSSIKGIMVGKGSLEKALLRMAEAMGIKDRLTLMSRISTDELAGLYSNCLCVVFCPFDEDYGFVTHEAFLSCKPVITVNDSGGVLEFVEDGVNGFVCDEDPKQMACMIEILNQDKAKAREMGIAGRDRVGSISYDGLIDDICSSLGL